MNLKKKIAVYAVATIVAIAAEVCFSLAFGKNNGHTSVVIAILVTHIWLSQSEQTAQKEGKEFVFGAKSYGILVLMAALVTFVGEGAGRLLDKML